MSRMCGESGFVFTRYRIPEPERAICAPRSDRLTIGEYTTALTVFVCPPECGFMFACYRIPQLRDVVAIASTRNEGLSIR